MFGFVKNQIVPSAMRIVLATTMHDAYLLIFLPTPKMLPAVMKR